MRGPCDKCKNLPQQLQSHNLPRVSPYQPVIRLQSFSSKVGFQGDFAEVDEIIGRTGEKDRALERMVIPVSPALPLHLIHQRPELVNILKAPVNACKADVGHLVEFFQLAHDQLADAVGGDFAQA